MASFLPLRAGGWAFGEILTSAQMNSLNTDFPFALNMRDGGSYAPSGLITIGGAGLLVTGSFEAFSSSFAADVTIGGPSTFNDIATFFAAIDASAGISGTSATFTGIVISGSGTASIGGNASVGGTLSVGGATNLAGNAVLGANASVAGRLTGSNRIVANGGIRLRTSNLGTLGASVAHGVDDADVFYIPDSTVSSINFTINNPAVTTVEDGIAIEVLVHAVNNVVVKDPGGATLITLTYQSGSPFAAKFYRIGGSWFVAPGTSVKP